MGWADLSDPWGGCYQQRLDIYRATTHLMRALARRRHFLNRVDLALDWTLESFRGLLKIYELLDQFHYKTYRRSKVDEDGNTVFQKVRYRAKKGQYFPNVTYLATRYTDDLSAPNNFASYVDKKSRIEPDAELCCHLEWRFIGRQSVTRAGFDTLHDLIALDHRAFWQKHLLFAAIDLRKLGLLRRLSVEPKSPRRSRPSTYFDDADFRTGFTIFRMSGSNTQGVLDRFGSELRVRRTFIPLDVQHLLPGEVSSL
jgi:hypothetical protein